MLNITHPSVSMKLPIFSAFLLFFVLSTTQVQSAPPQMAGGVESGMGGGMEEPGMGGGMEEPGSELPPGGNEEPPEEPPAA